MKIQYFVPTKQISCCAFGNPLFWSPLKERKKSSRDGLELFFFSRETINFQLVVSISPSGHVSQNNISSDRSKEKKKKDVSAVPTIQFLKQARFPLVYFTLRQVLSICHVLLA